MTKREGAAKSWCFTLNNYNESDFFDLLGNEAFSYIIMGKEKGKSGTPHLQGFCVTQKPKRMKQMKEIHAKAHWEKARAPAEAREYCKKEGDYHEKGLFVVPGARNDLVRCRELIQKKEALDEEAEAAYLKHRSNINNYVRELKQKEHTEKLTEKLSKCELRPWQLEAIERLMKQDNRKILVVVDYKGNRGKSFLTKWLLFVKGAFITTTDEYNHNAYMYDLEEICVFDFARPREKIDLNFIEDIKNGMVVSTKYESCRKATSHDKKVIVFCNQDWFAGKFSEDRLEYMYLDAW